MRKGTFIILFAAALLVAFTAGAAEREKLGPDTPYGKIVYMYPKKVDPTDLPLNSINELHETGTPQDIDISKWTLTVERKGITRPLSLSYEQLKRMEQKSERVLLICPGFFAAYAEWEGVLLETVLDRARVRFVYEKVVVKSIDGYKKSFSREQVDQNLIFLALMRFSHRKLCFLHNTGVK
jgi:hypothetical protein